MDDLLDLNFSDSTGTNTSRPNSAKPPPKPSSPFAFDTLSRPSSSANYYSSSSLAPTPSTRIGTPLTAPIPQAARLTDPPRPSSGFGNRPSSTTPAPAPAAAAKVSNDAFSSLLSLGPTAGGSGTESMAERAKRLEREKREKEERERKQFDHGDFWNQFGEGSKAAAPNQAAIPVLAVRPSGAKSNGHAGGFTGGFDDLLQSSAGPSATTGSSRSNVLAPLPAPTAAAAPKAAKSSKGTFWDTELLAPQSASSQKSSSSFRPSPSTTADPFDFDQLEKQQAGSSRLGTAKNGSGMRTPVSDFDWGDGGDGDDDDILGDLSRSVNGRSGKPGTANSNNGANGHASSSRPTPKTARSTSPPPHIIGQIVEMGFSPAQARAALAKTPSGLDVQAAIEALLGSGGAGPNSRFDGLERDFSAERDEDEEEEDFIQRERTRREEAERERRRARRAGPSRDTIAPRTRDELRSAGTSGRGTPDYSEQAEKYLAQASEIGTNVLSKASSFWAAGKEKAQKLYEEQKRAYEAQQQAQVQGQDSRGVGRAGERRKEVRAPVKDGRPRWMIDADAGDMAGEEKEDIGSGGFKDDSDEEASPSRPRSTQRPAAESRSRNAANPAAKVTRPVETYRSTKEKADLLFADEEKPYVPASRRRPIASATAGGSSSAVSRSATPLRVATPIVLVHRTLVAASPAQIERAASHKAKGNEHFKLGRFAESESAYSIAISALPSGHLHLIALNNNRAASRLKLGQSDGVVEDCGTVLDLIGPSYHPAKEAPLPSTPEYAEVKLAESMVKALIKRAQAYEMGEKWKKATEDWEKVMGLDSAFVGSGAGAQGTRNMAAEGARRAKRMSDGPVEVKPTPKPANGHAEPKPAARPTRTAAKPSAAVADLRQANALAEKEDAERLRLNDSVEAKLSAWKGGKETNLRALIASLDTVLWEGVLANGGKVGMHELISEKQVKIKYMKVIARLHPDKLDVKNTSVEQRMLANGVFGTLNEAWQAFQNGS